MHSGKRRCSLLYAVHGWKAISPARLVLPLLEVDEKEANDKNAKVPNPTYVECYAQDQQVPGLIFTSVGKEVLAQISAATTAAQAWQEVQGMFTAQTWARTMNVRLAMSTTKKGNLSITDYFTKMKGYTDEMAAARRPLDDEEITSHICNNLDSEFNPVVLALVTRVEPIIVVELYSQLLMFETRLKLLDGSSGSGSSANFTNKRGRSSSGGHGPNCGRGPGHGRGNQGQQHRPSYNTNQQRSSGNSTDTRPLCQVCFKKGHLASECWHRYDETYVPDERLVAADMGTYSVDTNWYTDTGATDHVTRNLKQLSIKDKYKGNDHTHTASGSSIEIKHIGHTIVPTPSRNLHLKNVPHVLQTAKNLVSVHHLAKDKSTFLEFHSDYFLVKDQATKTTILRGYDTKDSTHFLQLLQ
ncbi:uncharacterized protein LOC101759551 [Setaria italica]|uniref:uncharacterized protein LOC101759551 n=1 Tax=Setaria italica TaxID=4555 RepID=UPI0006492137|nr:uncharacterized protein LOC101759551 [Setaria italica]